MFLTSNHWTFHLQMLHSIWQNYVLSLAVSWLIGIYSVYDDMLNLSQPNYNWIALFLYSFCTAVYLLMYFFPTFLPLVIIFAIMTFALHFHLLCLHCVCAVPGSYPPPSVHGMSPGLLSQSANQHSFMQNGLAYHSSPNSVQTGRMAYAYMCVCVCKLERLRTYTWTVV